MKLFSLFKSNPAPFKFPKNEPPKPLKSINYTFVKPTIVKKSNGLFGIRSGSIRKTGKY